MPKRFWSAKVDANQQEIINALRAAGASVLPLHRLGGGAPDLLVGYRGANLLLEVKVERGTMNPRQEAWGTRWAGSMAVVRSPIDALAAVGARVTSTTTQHPTHSINAAPVEDKPNPT